MAYDVRWKLLQFLLPTRQSLAGKKVVDDPACIRCHKYIEDHEHWFFFCEKNYVVLQLLFQLLTLLFSPLNPLPIRQDWLLYGLELAGVKGELKLGNMFVDSYYQSVYTARNKCTSTTTVSPLKMFKCFCRRSLQAFRHFDKTAFYQLDQRVAALLR